MKRVTDTAITNVAWEGVRKGADGATVSGMKMHDYGDGTGNVEFMYGDGTKIVGSKLDSLDIDHVRQTCENMGMYIRMAADDPSL